MNASTVKKLEEIRGRLEEAEPKASVHDHIRSLEVAAGRIIDMMGQYMHGKQKDKRLLNNAIDWADRAEILAKKVHTGLREMKTKAQ